MEKERELQGPCPRQGGDAQYALAAALIWAAVGFGLWQNAAQAERPQLLMAARPEAARCNPS